MELSGRYFTYNGISSRMYGLVFAHVDTKSVTTMIGDVKPITVFNKREKKNYYIGESYENAALSFDAEVVILEDSIINPYIRRDIEKWLFHQPGYRKLYVDFADDSFADGVEAVNYDQKRTYLNCRFVNPERIEGNGGLVGYRFSVMCDGSMAWQEDTEFAFEFGDSANNTVDVLVDTDTNDYIYPKVTIKMGASGGDLRISNISDDPTRTTDFVDLSPNTTFTINGAGLNYISGGNYSKFSTRNFPRLLDGENRISITGDVDSVKFEFQNQRYM